MGHGHVPALADVPVEHLVAGVAGQHRRQLGGQVHCVVDPAVHAHGADRAVDVGRVAGQQHPPRPEGLGHPLVHGVQRLGRHLVGLPGGVEPLEPGLYDVVVEERVGVGVHVGGQHHPPQVGPSEQVGPFDRVEDVVAIAVGPVHGRRRVQAGRAAAVRLPLLFAALTGRLGHGLARMGRIRAARSASGRVEVEQHAQRHGAVREGEALELDAELLAHHAVGALAAHQVCAVQFLPLPVGSLDRCGHGVRTLVEGDQLGPGADLDQVDVRSHLQGLFDQLQAVALQRVGEAGVTGQHGVVEHRYGLGVAAVPVVDQGSHQPARLEALVQADVVEHLQRGRVDGSGPPDLIQQVHQLLDHHHPVAAACQGQGQHQPDRAGASDDHPIVSPGHRNLRDGAPQGLAARRSSPRW